MSDITDSKVVTYRSKLKTMALYLLSCGPINRLVVATMKSIPNAGFRSRIPVKGGGGKIIYRFHW